MLFGFVVLWVITGGQCLEGHGAEDLKPFTEQAKEAWLWVDFLYKVVPV